MHATHHHPHRPFAWLESWPAIIVGLVGVGAFFFAAATGVIP